MRCYRFGPFELDVEGGELRKHGLRFRIQNQPFQVLRALIERAGEVVCREDLRQAVWADETFVDFEHSLNAAMNKVRRVLGDSAESPRYIETVPGRGYRFIGVVQDAQQPVPNLPPAATQSVPSIEAAPQWTRRFGPWIAVAAVAVSLGVWGVVKLRPARDEITRPVVHFVFSPPPGTVFAPPISHQPFAISPDGTRLAFAARGPNGTSVWARELASLETHPVPGTEGAWAVFWSPDSRSIFYSVRRNLKQVNLQSGSARSVATLPFMVNFGTWRANGNLVVYLGHHNAYELGIENGSLRKLPNGDLRLPQFLPNSDRVLHVIDDPPSGRFRAQVTDLASGKSTTLMETDSRVQYVPPLRRGEPGKLLYLRGGSLLVQPFDVDKLHFAGEPYAILQNVIFFGPSAQACFSVSDNGVLVYQTGWPLSELKWYDRAGHAVATIGQPAPYAGGLRISPDGRQVAAAIWNPEHGRPDIWLFDTNGRRSSRLTYPPAAHYRPVWSPDGKRIAVGSSQTGPPHLAVLKSAETGVPRQLLSLASQEQAEQLNQIEMPTDWSPDGRFIAFDTSLGEEEQEMWLADTAEGTVKPLLHGESAQWGSVFSPDGRSIAFVSAESGRPEIYVQAYDANPSPRLVGEKRQVSREGAWIVRWRPDGRELFYVGIDNWLHAVPASPGFQFGDPKLLFRIEGNSQYGSTSDFQFDVTRDGQRFIMSTTGSVAAPAFTVLESWQEKFHR